MLSVQRICRHGSGTFLTLAAEKDLVTTDIRKWVSASPIRPIALGSIAAGVVDLAYAVVFNSRTGTPAIVIPQSIASGLIGMRAFREGMPSAVLGLVLHFGILFMAAAIYFLASRKMRPLAARPMSSGASYGLAIYLFMHAIVLPLSAAPKFNVTPLSVASDLVVHIVLIGPIVAWAIHWYPEEHAASAAHE